MSKLTSSSSTPTAPLLLIPDEEEHTWRVYDVMEDKFSELRLKVPYPKRFCGSSEGWLIAVNKDSTVTLHKPAGPMLTNSSVHLPCIFPRFFEPGIEDEEDEDFVDPTEVSDYHIHKAIVKYEDREDMNELTVVAIYGEFQELAFIRHGKDVTWSKINAPYNNIRFMAADVLNYKEEFYAISYSGGLVSLNIADLTVKWVAPPTEEIPTAHYNKYLVQSYGGELLLVKRYIDWPEDGDARETKSFEVFRFDFDGKEWIEQTSIGTTALFLGDNTSISVLASDFPGCQSNCIYFTHDTDDIKGWLNRMICDLGVYHMESKRFKLHYDIDPTALMTMSRRPPIWFVPKI